MKLHSSILHSLLSGAMLSYAIDVVTDKHDISPDAVVILLALAELHAKGQATPSVEQLLTQTLYVPSLFLEGIDALYEAGFLIRDGESVAATNKAAHLLKDVFETCQQEVKHRANRFAVYPPISESPLIQREGAFYAGPLTLFPLNYFSPEPTEKLAKPSTSKGRKQAKNISGDLPTHNQ